jgi:hypothetical protein
VRRGDAFDELLREADEHPVVGWDFSWLGGRLSSPPLPWDFGAMVVDRARQSPDLLDLGTGGGEFLASLEYRPPRTVATEGWPPNVDTARQRLGPLGIVVVPVDPPPDNDRQASTTLPRLPFPDKSFTLIASRHEAYVPSEVARILVADGVFLTQQVGGDYSEFHDALGLPRPPTRAWSIRYAIAQLEQAGLAIADGAEDVQATTFSDVGALAWFLKAIPWVVDGFSIELHRPNLERLDERIRNEGPVTVREPAFWLEARRP